jgi:hypothetical protein
MSPPGSGSGCVSPTASGAPSRRALCASTAARRTGGPSVNVTAYPGRPPFEGERGRLPSGIIPLSSLPQTSNNIIQKGLAFVCEQSGSVTVPGTGRASGSCPAGCMAEVGLWWWRQPRRTNGGSRCQDLPIRSSSFCPRLRGAMIVGWTCRRMLRTNRFERPSISSSALGCWKRSAPMARSWPGDAMLKLDPWRFASPSRASSGRGQGRCGWRSYGNKHLCGSCV